MKHKRMWLAMGILAATCTFGQTVRFLDAPVVDEKIGLRWGGTKMQIRTDDGQYKDVPADATYAAKAGVKITVEKLNPLKIRAAGSVKVVDDPTFLVLGEFLGAVKNVTGVVFPSTPESAKVLSEAGKAKDECSDPEDLMKKFLKATAHLDGKENLPTYLREETPKWIKAIDDSFVQKQPGWAAVAAGVEAVRETSTKIDTDLIEANRIWDLFRTCSAKQTEPNKTTYLLALLSGGDARMAQIADIQRGIAKLATSLETGYVKSASGDDLHEKWAGINNAEYVVADAQPTREKMHEITVKLTRVSFEIATVTSALSLKTEDLGSANLTVQRWSPWVMEKSVGAVFGVLKQPTYGTTTNAAGQTVVARVADKSLSVNPAIMMNLVCRCAGGLPMVQFGVATSKDLPAFLAGAGLRLFGLGKGDFSLSYGAMIGWYRDLNKLRVGSVITGTKDIDADLAFISKPHIKGYFGLQYKF